MEKEMQKQALFKKQAEKMGEKETKTPVNLEEEKKVKNEVVEGEIDVTKTANLPEEKKEDDKKSFDETLKDFERYSQMEIILRSSLLGHFEGDEYKISQEVARDLLKLPKIIDDQTVGKILCHSLYKDFTFKFLIVYDNFSTYSTARIYLLEDEDRVQEIKTHKTLIGESVQPGGKNIVDIITIEWNLKKGSNNGDGETDGGENMEVTDLDSILLGIKTDYYFSRELLEILSQIYILRMTSLLGECGVEGEKILSEYNKILKNYAINRPSVLQKYAMMKHILDENIKKNNGYEVLKTHNEKAFREVIENFYTPLEKINLRVKEKREMDLPSVAEKKAEKVEKTEQKWKPHLGEKGEKPYYPKPPKGVEIKPAKFEKGISKVAGSPLKQPPKPQQNENESVNENSDAKLAASLADNLGMLRAEEIAEQSAEIQLENTERQIQTRENAEDIAKSNVGEIVKNTENSAGRQL